MAITDTGVIDSVIHGNGYEDLVLVITDHLDWSAPQEHLLVLQQKLNTYIAFVESGQIFSDFPECDGDAISILIACQFEPSGAAIQFFEKAHLFLKQKLNIKLSYAIES
ncbi:DUF6572 domain-containing protein [Pseudoalteromonas sp. T1lg75]|uniref:DUF6572 domain-containing protein n=1 Tax=Pseudoalteromonas sp. T1lg75 TaxID=2077102 RepID=UPI000CF6BAF6|nr:DUF6572 domain-containing protein [Pseudoalteromonas sp. T1lg75]